MSMTPSPVPHAGGPHFYAISLPKCPPAHALAISGSSLGGVTRKRCGRCLVPYVTKLPQAVPPASRRSAYSSARCSASKSACWPLSGAVFLVLCGVVLAHVYPKCTFPNRYHPPSYFVEAGGIAFLASSNTTNKSLSSFIQFIFMPIRSLIYEYFD